MIEWLLDPFASSFTQRAAILCAVVAVLAPCVGTWIVLRRVAYLGDAMGHATIGGVAVAFALGGAGAVLWGGLIAGVVTALLVAALSRNARLSSDAIIGVSATSMFALGVIIIGQLDTGVALSHFLFGQLLTVTEGEVLWAVVIGALALGVVLILTEDLRIATFDPVHARQVGVRVGRIDLAILVVLAITIVLCLRTIGTLMSVSMLVVPASTARLVSRTVAPMMRRAVGFAVTSSFLGFVISYHLESAPGATIALVSSLVFFVVYIATIPRRHSNRGHRERDARA